MKWWAKENMSNEALLEDAIAGLETALEYFTCEDVENEITSALDLLKVLQARWATKLSRKKNRGAFGAIKPRNGFTRSILNKTWRKSMNGARHRVGCFSNTGELMKIVPIFGIVDGACTCGRPDCAAPGKHAILAGWPEKATDDAETIARWRETYPDCNFGVVCGPSGALVVDIDYRNGAEESLGEWQEILDRCMYVVKTGNGYHYYFACSLPLKKGLLAPGIEVKVGNSYVMAPGSVHHSGAVYTLIKDDGLVACPSEILERLDVATEHDGESGDVETSWLYLAMRRDGLLGKVQPNGMVVAQCPREHLHSSGSRFDGSTVLCPPSDEFGMGWLFCSHAHCQDGDALNKEIKELLSGDAVKAADEGVRQAKAEVLEFKTWLDKAKEAAKVADVEWLPQYEALPEDQLRARLPSNVVKLADEWKKKRDRLEKVQAEKFGIVPGDFPMPENIGLEYVKQVPKKNRTNVMLVLTRDSRWKGLYVYDTFKDRVAATRSVPRVGDIPCPEGDFSDAHLTYISIWINRVYGFEPSSKDVHETIKALPRVNVLRNYVTSLTWDGTPRIDVSMRRYWGVEDLDAYHIDVGRALFLGGALRALEPGAKFDFVVVFYGKQGAGKSRSVKALSPDERWYSNSVNLLSRGKEEPEKLRGLWIVEVAEMIHAKRADNEAVKAFISTEMDQFRSAYGHVAEHRARQCIFVGTTNDATPFTDVTGNRRYLPVHCGDKIDVDALLRDRDQLWAEAVHRVRAGDTVWTVRDAEEVQERFRNADEWEDTIQRNIISRIQKNTIKRTSPGGEPYLPRYECPALVGLERFQHSDGYRFNRCMEKLGWKLTRRRKENLQEPEPCQEFVRVWTAASLASP